MLLYMHWYEKTNEEKYKCKKVEHCKKVYKYKLLLTCIHYTEKVRYCNIACFNQKANAIILQVYKFDPHPQDAQKSSRV